MRTLSIFAKRMFSTLLAVAVVGSAALLSSCGSASNNDQGSSFSAYGFFLINEEGEVEPDTFITALIQFQSIPFDVGLLDLSTAIGVRNNLTGQNIRVQRAVMQYIIPGASAQPPDTSTPLNFVLGPIDNTGTSLPDQPEIVNELAAPFTVVPAEIFSWMILNRESLPQPPFTMEAVVTVRGITSAGDVLDTNPLTLPITIIPDLFINPTDGSTGGQTDEVSRPAGSSGSSGGTPEASPEPSPTTAPEGDGKVEP